MKKSTIIRKIGNDIENIFSNRNINIEDYEDILLNSHVEDSKGYIYRLDVNEDGTMDIIAYGAWILKGNLNGD